MASFEKLGDNIPAIEIIVVLSEVALNGRQRFIRPAIQGRQMDSSAKNLLLMEGGFWSWGGGEKKFTGLLS